MNGHLLAFYVVAVFLAGLFWKRASATGAFTGLISGLVISVALVFGIKYTPMAHWHFLYVVPLMLTTSLAIVICVSLLTAAPAPEQISKYVWGRSVFQAESKALAGVPWFKNYRILSALLLLLAAAFVYIWR